MKTKRFLMAAILIFATVFVVKADNDKPIDFSQLPETSKVFIKKYFNEKDISFAKEERDFFSKSYDVVFVNGTKVEFDKKGNWENVDCLKQEVPAGIVPAPIVDYVANKHLNQKIVKIERDRRDYEIELDNNIEIKFDLKFRVIEYDN